jgi:hypothetical protein
LAVTEEDNKQAREDLEDIDSGLKSAITALTCDPDFNHSGCSSINLI